MRRGRLLPAILTVAAVSAAAAAPIFRVRMRTIDGEPAMVNAPNVFSVWTGHAHVKVIAINPNTGVLYGLDTGISNNGRPQLYWLDSAMVSTPSVPTNALVGTTGNPGGDNTTAWSGAIRATIPSDGTTLRYEVVDLDKDSEKTYVQLIDTVAGADVGGTGIAFDANQHTLYVAGQLDYSTGNSTYDQGRFYLFGLVEVLPTLLLLR